MAFPELPDDRRARPRRYRGGDAPEADPNGHDRSAEWVDSGRYEAEHNGNGSPQRRAPAGRDTAQEQDWLLGAALQHGVPARNGAGSGSDAEPPRPARSRRAAPEGGAPEYGGGRHGAANGGADGGHRNGHNGSANGNGVPRPAPNGNGGSHADDDVPRRRSAERIRDAYPFDGAGREDAVPRRRQAPAREDRSAPTGRYGAPGANGHGPTNDRPADPPVTGRRRRREETPAPGPTPQDLVPPPAPRRPEWEAPEPGAPSGAHRAAGRQAPGDGRAARRHDADQGPADPRAPRPDVDPGRPGRYRDDAAPRRREQDQPPRGYQDEDPSTRRTPVAPQEQGRGNPRPDAEQTRAVPGRRSRSAGPGRPPAPPAPGVRGAAAAMPQAPAEDVPAGRPGRVRRDPDRVTRRPDVAPPGGDGPGDDHGPGPDATQAVAAPTTEIPTRRRRAAGAPRPGAGRNGAPETGETTRGRGAGPEPSALSDGSEPDDRDDAPDAGPDSREQKPSGPVGLAGKLSALTAGRGRSSGGGDGKRQMSFWKELPLLIGVALVLTFLIQTFVAKVFVIPSGSMETTLHGCTGCTNDRVLVDKVTYNFSDIAPGDVVVFRGPDSWSQSEYQLEESSNPLVRGLQTAGSLIGFAPPDEKDFVKRVIAVGGQTVACCDALNQVMVDGQPLDEPYVYYLPEAGPARQIPFGPIKVPEGEMWMMGDSRNNSADSRASGHGPVPEENVIGKVRLVVLPFARFGWVDAVDPQTTQTAMGADGLPAGAPLALGMMGTFPLALGRRRSLRRRAEDERFLPDMRPPQRWRRRS